MTITTKTDSNDENKAEDDDIVMVTNLDLIFFGGIRIIRQSIPMV